RNAIADPSSAIVASVAPRPSDSAGAANGARESQSCSRASPASAWTPRTSAATALPFAATLQVSGSPSIACTPIGAGRRVDHAPRRTTAPIAKAARTPSSTARAVLRTNARGTPEGKQADRDRGRGIHGARYRLAGAAAMASLDLAARRRNLGDRPEDPLRA